MQEGTSFGSAGWFEGAKRWDVGLWMEQGIWRVLRRLRYV